MTSNIPQIYDSPVDINLCGHIHLPSLISHRSRVVTLTILYDNYVMCTFTYADIPSLSESRHNSHFVF